MKEPRRSIRPLIPALQASLVVVIALAVLSAMLAAAEWWDTDRDLGTGYPLWAGVVTISIVIWAFIFASGVRANANGIKLDVPSRWRVVGSCILLGVLAIVVVTFLRRVAAGDGVPDWSEEFTALVTVLTAVAFIAASPWILLIWTTHGRLSELREMVSLIVQPPPGDEYDPQAVDARRLRSAISEMDAIWRTVERSSLALGLLLSTTVVNTAFLRTARIAAGASEDDFPPWTVVGYGAFFAVVLVLILMPVLIGWRDDGMRMVRRALGEARSGVPSDSQNAARARLLARTGLDRPALLRPIALLGVLAPFLTGFFTSLIPT